MSVSRRTGIAAGGGSGDRALEPRAKLWLEWTQRPPWYPHRVTICCRTLGVLARLGRINVRLSGSRPRVLVLVLALVLLSTACGATAPPTTAPTTTPAAGTAASSTPASSATRTTAAAAQPTPIPRTGGPRDLILSTTTSTQDSGLLDELIPLFQRQSGYSVKTVSVGSGAAIALGQRGEVDVVLAHAPESERAFVTSGVGTNRQLVMFNDFIIVGPAGDPAGIRGQPDAVAALWAIAGRGSPFISRGDNSGTQQLELALWREGGIAPRGQGWYVESGTGMGQTLQIADQRGAYTISDRGTYLSFRNRVRLEVLVERDERLLNVYHVIAVNPQRFPSANAAGAQAFIDFLLAPETQRFIGDYGRDRFGQPLFTPCAHNSCNLKDPKD